MLSFLCIRKNVFFPFPAGHFNNSGPMAETAILGNIAFFAGHKSFDWDVQNMVAVNCPEMEPHIKPEFDNGWKY